MKRWSNQLVIELPEGYSFSLLLAGPISRFLAWLVDMLCVLALLTVIGQIARMLGWMSLNLAHVLMFLGTFVVWFGYGILLECIWQGRTVGKRILKLRVVDEHGFALAFPQVALRNLLRIVDMLPWFYLVAGISCLLTRRSQRLGDLASGTVVIRTPSISQPNLSRVLGGKFNSFSQYPHLEARLRNRISPSEARVLVAALLRRDRLDPEARLELFEDLVDHFRHIVQFPEAATEGLSAEQYLRNIADGLFRHQSQTRS